VRGNTEDISTDVWIFQGDQDRLVPTSQADTLARAVARLVDKLAS